MLTIYEVCNTIVTDERSDEVANLNIHISDNLKKQAETVFNSFGLSTPDAIIIFLKEAVHCNRIPFELTSSTIHGLPEVDDD